MADVVRTFGISLGVSGIPQFRTGLGKAMEHMDTFSKHVEEFGGKLDQFDAISDKLSSGVSKMAKAMGEMGGDNKFNKSASGLAKFMKSFNDASANYLKPEQFERSLESVVKISQAIHTANVHAQETLRLVAESKKALSNFKSAEGSDEFVKNMVLGASARDMTAAVIGGDEKLRVVLKRAISQTRSIIRDAWGSSKLAEESKNQVLEELEKMARESVSFESLMIFVDDLKRKLPQSQSMMAATLENNSASIIASMKAHREKIQAEVDKIIVKNEAMGEDYRASFFRGKNAALSPKTTTTAKGSTAYDFFSGAMGKMFDAAPSILQRDKVTVGWDESGAAIRNIENVAKSVANAARIMIDGGADIKKATGTISEAIIPLESADLISAADSISAYNSIGASIKAMKQQRDAMSANEAAFRRLDLIMRGIPASMVDLRSEFSALIGNMKSGAFSLDDLDNKLYLLGLRMSRADFGEGGFSARIDGQAVELNQAIEMVAKDIPTTLRDSLKKAFTDKPLDGSEIFGKRFKENAIGTLYHTLLEVYKSAEGKLIANIDQDISTKAAAEEAKKKTKRGAKKKAAEAAPEVTAGLTGAFDEVPWDEKGAQAAQEYIDGMKAAAGIHSPSEVARKQIGIPLGEGMAIGVAQGFVGEGLKDIIRDAFAILGRQVNVELENLTYAGAKKMASDAIRDIAALGAAGDADMLASASRLSKRRSALASTDPTKLGAAAGRSMADTLVAIRDNTKATVNAILALATRPVGVGPTVAGAVSGAAAGVGSVSGAAAAAGATAGAAAAAGATAGAAAAGAAAGATAGATAVRGKGAYPISDPFDRLPHPAPLTVDDTKVSANDLYRNFMMRASKQATDAKEQINVAKNRDLSGLSQADSDRMTAQVDALLETAQDRINESFDQTGKNYHDIMVTFQGILRDYQEGIEKIDQELAEAAAKTRDDRTVEREKRKVQAQLKRGLDVATAQHSLDTQIEKLQRGLLGAIQQRRVAAGDSSILAKQETEVRDYITDLKTRAAVEIGNWTAKGLAPEQLGKAIGTFIRDMNLAGSELRSNIRENAGAEVVSGGAQTEIAKINAQIKRRNENLKKLIETYGSGSPEIKALYLDILKQNSMDQAAITDAISKANRSSAAGPAMQRKNLAAVNAVARVETDRLNESAKRLGETYRELLDVESQANGATHDLALTLGASASTFKDFLTTFDAVASAHKGKIDIMLSSGSPKALIDRENEAFDKRTKNAKANAIKLKEAYGAIDKARTRMENSARKLSPAGAQSLRDNFESEIAPFLQALNNVRFDSLPNEVAEMVAAVSGKMSFLKTDVSSTVTDVNSSITKLQTQINSLGKWRDTMTRSVEDSDLTKAGKKGALGEIDKQYKRILRNIQGATDSALAAQGLSFDEFIVNTKDQIARATDQIDKMLNDPKGMSFRRRFSAVNAAYADATSKFVDISKITYQEFKKFRDAEKELARGDLNDRMLKLTERLKLFVYGFRYGHPWLIKFGQGIAFIGKALGSNALVSLGILGNAVETLVFHVLPQGVRGFANLGAAIARVIGSDLKAIAGKMSALSGSTRKAIGSAVTFIPASLGAFVKKFDIFSGTFRRLQNELRGIKSEEKQVASASSAAAGGVDRFGDAAREASADVNTLSGSAQVAHQRITNFSKTSSSLNKLSIIAGGNVVAGMGQGFVQAINSGGFNAFEGGLNKKTILTGIGLAMGASLVRGVINSIQNAGYQVRNAFRSIFTRGVNEFMTREAVQGSLAFGVLDDQLRNAYKDKGGITNATKGTEEYATALKEARIQGEELYKWLSELAVLSPFGKEEIQPLLKMALGSFDKENAKSIVATGIDVASVSQNAQDAEAYVRALSQIGAAGFLKKEDLNQINNMMAGNQILLDNLIDKDTKLPRFTTTGEMLDAITKKSITATEAIEAFQKGASLIFGGAAADMGGSLKGLLSSISDAINERLADAITPAIEQVGKPLIAFFFTLLRSDKVVGFFNRIGESIAVFARNALTAFSGIYAFVSAIINMIPESVRKGIGAFLAFGAAAGALGVVLQIAALAVPILGAAILALFNPISLILGGMASLYVSLSSAPKILADSAGGISIFGKAADVASSEIQALRETAASSIRPLVALGAGALDLYGDVQRGTKGSQSRWEKFASDFRTAVDTNITKPLAKMRADFGKWLLGWAQWWQAMAKTAWENIKKIPQMLMDVGAKMYSYGKNIVTWLAQGILDGAGAVLDAIFYIGGIIEQWIMPGSPPKFLPDIDKWGRETADVYLQGWTKADFGLVKDIASTIAGYLASDDGALTNKESDAIYEAAAQAVSRFKETGVFDASGIQALSGDLSIEMGRLANAYALAAKSAAEMAAAQADLDAKTKEYDDLLKGLNKRLDILKGEETAADIEGQVKELQRVLNNAYATTQQRQLATNKIAQLRLEQEIAATEKRRDAELATIQERIDLSTKENKTATEALELMKERLDLSYSVGKKDAPGGGGGDTADTGVDKPDKGKEGAPEETELDLPKVPKMDLGTDELTKRIEEMKEKVTTALDGAKTAIGKKGEEIKKTLGEVRDAFMLGWGGGEGGENGVPQKQVMDVVGFSAGVTVDDTVGAGIVGMIADVGAAASQYRPEIDKLTGSVNAAKTEFTNAYNETPGSFIDKVFAGFNTQTIQEKIATAKTEIKGLSDYVKSEEFKANVELQISKINLDTASKSLTGFRDKVIAEINSYTVEDKSLDGFRDEMVKELGETDLSPTAMTEFATNIVKHAGLAFGLVSMAGLAGSIASALIPALGKVGWLGVAGSLASAIAGGIGALGPVGWVVVGGAVAAAIGTAVSGALDIDFGADPKETGEKIQDTVGEWTSKASTMVANFVNWITKSIAKIDWPKLAGIAGYTTVTLLAGLGRFIAESIQKIEWGELLYNALEAAAGIIGGFIVGAFVGGVDAYEAENKEIEEAGKRLAENGERPFVNVLTRLANFIASIASKIVLLVDNLPGMDWLLSDDLEEKNKENAKSYAEGGMPYTTKPLPDVPVPSGLRPAEEQRGVLDSAMSPNAFNDAVGSFTGDPLVSSVLKRNEEKAKETRALFANMFGAVEEESKTTAAAIAGHISSGISQVDYNVLFNGMTPAGRESGASASGEIKTKIDATKIDAPIIYGPLKKEATVKAKEAAGEFLTSFSAFANMPQFQRTQKDIGGGVIHGIISGMSEIAMSVDDSLGGSLSTLIDKALTYLGIESPSKKTHEEIGVPMGQGILLGTGEALKETDVLLTDVNTVFTDITTEATTVLDAFFLASTQSWVTYVGDTELQWISLKDRILLVAEQLKLAVTSKVQELADASRTIVDGIIAYFSSEDYIARWYGTGQNLGTAIGTGIADGMNGETVRGAIEDAAGSLIDLVRRELRDAAGVQSPSKVMAADVGRPLGLGVIQGMAQTGTEAQTAAGNFVAMMLAASMQAISRNGTISAPRASAYSAETELHVPDRTINQYNLYMSVTPSQAERINDNFRIMEIMS